MVKKILCIVILLAFTNLIFADLLVAYQYKKSTVAVLNFQSNTGDAATDAMLSEGTAETIITDLSNIKEIEVIERSKLVKLNQEISYGMTGMVDEKTAQRAGRQIGAQYIIIGSWQKFGNQVRVNARLVEVETASIIASIKETGYKGSIFEIQDNIVTQILEKLDITLTSADRYKIRKRKKFNRSLSTI